MSLQSRGRGDMHGHMVGHVESKECAEELKAWLSKEFGEVFSGYHAWSTHEVSQGWHNIEVVFYATPEGSEYWSKELRGWFREKRET